MDNANPYFENGPINNTAPGNGSYVENANQNMFYPNVPQMAPQAQPAQPGQPGATLNKKDNTDLIKTIAIIVLTVFTLTFLGLFVWMYVNWNTVSTDVNGKIDLEVAKAKNSLQAQLENDFAEKEKYPYYTFGSVPNDYGALSFEYPKTWSTYVPEDGSQNGSDFHAYLNPGQVKIINDETVMALRVSIVNEATEEVKEDYTDKVEDGEMTISTTVVNGINVDVYTGLLDSELQGIVCIFKLRDKTVILQTDSKDVFRDDFYRILSTIKFNA